MISAGDQFIWNFPNCGNPQKVQRYPLEWAASLRAMIAKDATLFVPAHGLPIAGTDRINRCLATVADTLETLVDDVLAAMNAGATLDDVVNGVTVDPEVLELPYLRPLYDEPEFVVRNVWRLYGGWWDGNPSHLKPASDAVLGGALADGEGHLRLGQRRVDRRRDRRGPDAAGHAVDRCRRRGRRRALRARHRRTLTTTGRIVGTGRRRST